MIEAIAMILFLITSLGNDDTNRDKGVNNKNKPPDGFISIHLADRGNGCSIRKDGSVVQFRSAANDRGTTDVDGLPSAEEPAVKNKFKNENIIGNVETTDDDDSGGDKDDINNATIIPVNNEVQDSEGENSLPNNYDTD